MISTTVQRRVLSRFLRSSSRGAGVSSPCTHLRLWATNVGDRCSSSTSTYYDSQSGQHVPIHDENQVSILLALDENDNLLTSRANIEEWQAWGIRGILARSTRNFQSNAEALSNLSSRLGSTDFLFFLSALTQSLEDSVSSSLPPKNVVPMFEFREGQVDSLQTALLQQTRLLQEGAAQDNNNKPQPMTAILIDASQVGDAMLTASAVAGILDIATATPTGTGIIDYIIVAGQRLNHGDDIVELAEELSYLDVTGPTMKSRLVVDLSCNTNQEAEETLDDCLTMGVNKFVIDHERVKWIGHFVRDEAGKECAVWSM